MNVKNYQTVTRESLKERLEKGRPDNRDPDEGFAVVNVLDEDTFEKEHIPASINIPQDDADEFERRFSKDKEIVVYCASPDCDASPKVASKLAERGFTRVFDFEGGMSAWKDADYPVERGARAGA